MRWRHLPLRALPGYVSSLILSRRSPETKGLTYPTSLVFSQALRSPAAGQDAAPEKFVADLLAWLQACRDGTVECVHGLLAGLRGAVERVVSLFNAPGEGQAPRSEL